MPDGPRRIYWDACIFISYIQGDADRLPILEALLEQSGRGGDIQIVTSELSRAEVAYAESERVKRALDPAVEARIDALWADTRAIKTVEIHQLITNEARQLIRQSLIEGRSLRANDVIHLATARWLKAAEIHTYDKKWFTLASLLGCPIVEPRVDQPKLFTGIDPSGE
jgi:predicted nucleic acid-binding protein